MILAVLVGAARGLVVVQLLPARELGKRAPRPGLQF